jgi:WASH complex subunit strumpellin
LIDIDEQFKEAYIKILERFYTLFESIHQYYLEINEYIDKVQTSYFVDYSIE